MFSITMENDGHDKERILTSLACKFPDKVFTEMDQVGTQEYTCTRKLFIVLGKVKKLFSKLFIIARVAINVEKPSTV